MWWKWVIGIIVGINLVILNVTVFKLATKKTEEKIVEKETIITVVPTPVEKKITATIKPTEIKKVINPKTRRVSYVPIPGNGSTLNNSWTSFSGTDFYFNESDFPGLKEVYFESNMKLLNGNGLAFVRLFDVTNGVEIWGSEVQTSFQTDTLIVSGKLTIRNGNNLIRVQAKSLTADTTVFSAGRLKVITEN
jgi:hypothetical protein